MALEAKPPSSTTVAPPASNPPPPPGSGGGGTGQECAGCGKRIRDRFLLKALDLLWHEDCLKCGCCDCRLGELGSSLYTKADLILCRRDYLRLFGHTGLCAACAKPIPAFEMVMRARSNVYHLECFACQQCNHRFCVGDRFYLCENKILCEYDYEERLVFANLAYSGSSPGTLAQQLKAAARHHHHPSQVPPPPPPPPPPLNGQPPNSQVNGNGTTTTTNGQTTPSLNGGPPQTSPASAPTNNPGQTTLGEVLGRVDPLDPFSRWAPAGAARRSRPRPVT